MERSAPDRTFLSERKLKTLAAAIPTPFYLYDAAGIAARAASLQAAFSALPAYRSFFPVRFCPYPEILTLLHDAGCGALCRNQHELQLACESGFLPQDILYSGVGECDRTIMCIADNPQLLPPTLPQRILLRYNPGGRLTLGAKTLYALDRSRLGMPKDDLIRTAQLLKSYGVQEIGLSFSGASNELRTEYLPAVAKLLFTLAAELRKQHDIRVCCCCLGDGLGVSLKPEIPDADAALCAKQILALYREILAPAGLGELPVYLTPGRYLLAPNAIFLTHVLCCKRRAVPLIIVDAAASQFPDTALKGRVHHISVLGKCTAAACQQVCAVAAQTDFQLFSPSCVLPPVEAGALLVFHTAGCVSRSYVPGDGFAPAQQYLLMPDGTTEPLASTAW